MPPRKAPKIASVEGHDSISNLPDGVLQHILSFLLAQDVVRTCVLAKRWRHLWKSTNSLRFVCGFGWNVPTSMEEIEEFVDHMLRLRLREGNPLDTCEFDFGLVEINEGSDFDISRINLWIRIALQCKVRVLQVFCHSIEHFDDHPFFVSQYLKKLELGGLEGIDLLPSRLFDFSCCPNLEDLTIAHCNIRGALLISSQSIKRLTIEYCHFHGNGHMPICTPNLVSLWLEVRGGLIPSLQTMPSLLTACVKFHDEHRLFTCEYDKDSNQSIVLHSLSEVQSLELTSHHSELLIFRRELKFCSSFNKLKSLLLSEYWCEPANFSALACIFKLSPVLEKLTLQLYCSTLLLWEPKPKVEIKLICKSSEMSAAISQHLKTIEIISKVYDERVRNVLTFLSTLNIWFQFGG